MAHSQGVPLFPYWVQTACFQKKAAVDAQLQPDGIRLTLQSLDPSHEAHGRPLELAWR